MLKNCNTWYSCIYNQIAFNQIKYFSKDINIQFDIIR